MAIPLNMEFRINITRMTRLMLMAAVVMKSLGLLYVASKITAMAVSRSLEIQHS